MALYFAVHTYKKEPAEFGVFLAARAAHIAKSMAAGKTPARCIKTWDPSGQGRVDYLFCVWDAAKAEDVKTTLQDFGLLDYLTADIMQANETDWAQLAQVSG